MSCEKVCIVHIFLNEEQLRPIDVIIDHKPSESILRFARDEMKREYRETTRGLYPAETVSIVKRIATSWFEQHGYIVIDRDDVDINF
jgi:hypothetical protein